MLNSTQTAIACARICDELKAQDVLVLDIRKLTQFADYFVLCTGASARQLRAISERIQRHLKDHGVRKFGVEGEAEGGWILLDYVDAVVHIFSPGARGFYQLEMLWGDAPEVDWQAPPEEAEQGA
ncbi:MAG: ribosome silencing factor [Candidatus Brocadiia bacterium]